MADSSVLVDVDKYVGSGIALIGALVASPDGTRWFTKRIWSTVSQVWRRGPAVHHVFSNDTLTLRDSASATVTRAWPAGETVEQRIERLRIWVALAEETAREVGDKLQAHAVESEQALATLTRTHEADVQELRELIEAQGHTAARIDGRALPVIGWGILLSGIPEALAGIPWGIGWFFPVFGLGITGPVLYSVVKDWWRLRHTTTP